MPQSENAAAWFAAVCQAVQEVPLGRVTTYGHIAKLIGRPECPRQVGTVMKHLPESSPGLAYHNGNVPWQRVINAKGTISPRYAKLPRQSVVELVPLTSSRAAGEASYQADALRAEGVRIGNGSLGEFTVSLSEYGWFPEELSRE